MPASTTCSRQANSEIGRQIATDVLIIEDEPLIAADLKRMLGELGHRVTSIARTHKDAMKAAACRSRGWCWPTSGWPTAARASMR